MSHPQRKNNGENVHYYFPLFVHFNIDIYRISYFSCKLVLTIFTISAVAPLRTGLQFITKTFIILSSQMYIVQYYTLEVSELQDNFKQMYVFFYNKWFMKTERRHARNKNRPAECASTLFRSLLYF